MTRRVLFFSRDPGSTNQMVAVHELAFGEADGPDRAAICRALGLEEGTPAEAVRYAKRFAKPVWRAAGVAAKDWDAAVPAIFQGPVRQEAIRHLLARERIDAVVTGADDIDEPDRAGLWLAARFLALPVIVFLDNRLNLGMRLDVGEDEPFAPTHVFALDASSVPALGAAGVPHRAIRVIADPHLARLKRIAEAAAAGAERLRQAWNLPAGTRAVLFASENTAEMAAAGREPPWDEFAVLDGLIADLAAGRPVGPLAPDAGPVAVVIRPHPRDTAGKYDRYAASGPVRVIVSTEGQPSEAIFAADAVAGMNSALLYEAEVLGRPAVSLVPESEFNRRAAPAERDQA